MGLVLLVMQVSSRVKSMNVVSLAEGNALAIHSMQVLSQQGDVLSSDRLFKLAMLKFQEAIR
jgi:hypothetical protein